MTQAQTSSACEKGRFKETCGPCGAVFEVIVMGEPMAKPSQEERADYACPECGQPYYCRGSEPPRVRLISTRAR